jgi:hypothetical protein
MAGNEEAGEIEANAMADAVVSGHRVAAAETEPNGSGGQIAASLGGGRPLTRSERAYFEPAFGFDFSQVRIRDDAAAGVAARSVDALAYTLGSQVIMRPGIDVAGTASGRRLLAHELAHVVQQAGSSGPILQRQPVGDPQTEKVDYDSVYFELGRLTATLVELNAKPGVVGERSDLTAELSSLMSELGGPGEKSDAQLADIRRRVQKFREEREEDRKDVMAWWPLLTSAYRAEASRLASSAEASDRLAGSYLSESYDRAAQRLRATGQYARMEDVSPFANDLMKRRHLEKAWEVSLGRAVQAAERSSQHGGGGHWPWPGFETTAKLVEGAAKGGHVLAENRERLIQALDSAIRHQIREAVTEMVELGETPGAARAWAAESLKRAKEASEGLVDKIHGRAGTALERWSGKLHIAGKLTIAIDVVGSIVDVIASPPAERPKKIVVQTSRIAGGLAGVRGGAVVGERFGRIFGPEGEAAGAFIGGVLGGIGGAWLAEEVSEFIADEIWPPEDTYAETVGP